jgi:membrane-bound metal-dependent hydrolase YbcI (DUF457 family)
MPSPIAHVAAGIAVHTVLRRHRRQPERSWGLLSACIGLSMLPDLDALVGIALGNFGRYHNNFAGSPLFGVMVALVAAILWRAIGRGSAREAALLTLVCYQLHVWMDFFTVSRGVMLLWPFTDARFHPPVHLFYGVRWSDGLISARHLITVGTELITVAALLAALRFGRPRSS